MINLNKDDISKFIDIMGWESNKDEFKGQFVELRPIHSDKGVKQKFFSIKECDTDTLYEVSKECYENKYNVYIGYSLRREKSGKEDGCSYITALVIDYDDAVDGRKIKSIEDEQEKKEARHELLETLKSLDPKPTMIVSSGSGYHCYYSLKEPISAEANKKAIKSRIMGLNRRTDNFKGDSAMKRLNQPIRLPGSINCKDLSDLKACKVVSFNPDRKYSLNDLPEYQPKKSEEVGSRDKGKVVKVTNLDCNIPFLKCEFLNWMMENPKMQTYDLWFAAAMNLAPFGKEGREFYHKLSRGYDDYDDDETNQKFNEALDALESDIWATKCETIQGHGYNCNKNDCTHKTPANLITKLKEKADLKKLGFYFYQQGKKAGQIKGVNSNQLVRYYRNNINPILLKRDQYYVYEGGYWQEIEENVLLARIREVINNAKKDIWTPRTERKYKVTLKRASAFEDEFNSNREFLNLRNGMLNLQTFELEEHDPEFYSTVRVDIPYDEEADCPRFKQFMAEVMEGDQERIRVLQEWYGYCLTSNAGLCSKIFFFYGQGANGKSVALEILTALVGEENVSNITLGKIEDRFGRANLVDKTVNISTENELTGEKLKTEYLKSISSGDRIDIEHKGVDSFSYKPMAKLIFALNSLPDYVPDRTYALYRRLKIVPFNRRFSEEEADKNLAQNIIDNELPGILQWALEGLKRLRANDYTLSYSQVIEDALEDFKEHQDPVHTFLKRNIEVVEGEEVKKQELKSQFYDWCRDNNHKHLVEISDRKFWGRVERILLNEYQICTDDIEKKINGRGYYGGLKLKEVEVDKDDSLNLFG